MTTFCCDFERVFSLSELRASSTDIVWRLYHICHSKRFIALAAISLIEFPPPSSLVSLLGKLLSGTEVRDCLWQTSDRNIRLWRNFHHSDKHFVILLFSWLFYIFLCILNIYLEPDHLFISHDFHHEIRNVEQLMQYWTGGVFLPQ